MSTFHFPDLPPTYAETRDHLHQLAFFALSPARHHAIGRMGLRHHDGGFGTPEFEGRTIRVVGDTIIDEVNGVARTCKITTVGQAVEFLDHEYEAEWFSDFHDPLSPLGPDEPLSVDPEASRVIGEWFSFAWLVLERLKTHAVEGDDPSEVQLWPEHFDAATELGDYDKGQRASYGASPGDANHAEPYLYVAAWSAIDRDNPYWNDGSFNGSSLTYTELKASDDPVGTALEFFLEGHRILHG